LDDGSAYQRFKNVRKRSGSISLGLVKLRLVIEFDPEVKRWSAVFPELPGCASAGDTEEEAVANAKEALALWFEPADLPLAQGAKVLELALP
jgi:predicted RNase H-like HicB family nuclease